MFFFFFIINDSVKHFNIPQSAVTCKMSLLSYFSKTKRSNEEESSQSSFFLPGASDSGLGQQEYENVVSNVIDLASPASRDLLQKKQKNIAKEIRTHIILEKQE